MGSASIVLGQGVLQQQLKQVYQTAYLSSMEGGAQNPPKMAMLQTLKRTVYQCQRILVSDGFFAWIINRLYINIVLFCVCVLFSHYVGTQELCHWPSL